MSLEYAILGFLNYLPLSGYDLKKRFDQSVQFFWPADQSQIYQTLARMTSRGWTEVELQPQTSKPSRKVYHITTAGRAALADWLRGPLPEDENRSAVLIQVFFSGALSDADLLEKFDAYAARMRRKLEYLQSFPAIINGYEHELTAPREAFCWSLTLEMGVRSTRAHLEWAESARARIAERMAQAGEVPSIQNGGLDHD